MFGRKIFFLAAGYVAGNVVSSFFSNKKGKELQSDVKKAKQEGTEKEVVISNFLETQKNLFHSIESLIPKEYKKTFEAKKQEALSMWDTLKKQWEHTLIQVKEQGSDLLKTAESKKVQVKDTATTHVATVAKKVAGAAKKVEKKAKAVEKKVKS